MPTGSAPARAPARRSRQGERVKARNSLHTPWSATHTTDRLRQASGALARDCLVHESSLFAEFFQPLARLAPHVGGRGAAKARAARNRALDRENAEHRPGDARLD